MAINVNRGLAGLGIRVPGSETPSAQRAAKVTAAEPTAETELSGAEVKNAGENPAFEANLSLTRPVEQIEHTEKPRLAATNRTLSFDTDEQTGRKTITVIEEHNGQRVERQIPEPDYLAALDRLNKVKNEALAKPRPQVDLDG